MNQGQRDASRRRERFLALLASPLLMFWCGCPFGLPESDVPGGADSTAAEVADTGDNNSLNSATALGLSEADDHLVFRGFIDSSADIDVFDLGTLAAGDRLYADIQRTSGNLDPTAAVFDSREHLIVFNDDREPDGSNLNPQIDIVIPGPTDTYFLAIIAYPGHVTTGEYEVTVRVQRGLGVPNPQEQIVFLDWRGGDVVIDNIGAYTLPAFSATDVGLSADDTAAFKDRVQALVQERYDGFDILVLNSDDHAEPAGAHSTVYFGGTDAEAFAISEQIDSFNADPSDDAIVFTRSYKTVFPGASFEQLAQAVANTVAHEQAHLLGLVHTHDCDGLMDTTCYNERLLFPQEFKTSRLDDSVFPFGWQDAEEILSWVLGLIGP